MIYVFHGADEYSVAAAAAALRAEQSAGDATAGLNSSDKDGRRLTVGELAEAASAMPFLASYRLVVVHGMLARLDPRGEEGGRKELAASLIGYLAAVPETTRLAFLEGVLSAANPVLKWAQGQPSAAATVRIFDAPKSAALPTWLARRARERKGAIDAMAAQAVADALDREGRVDLRRADSELEKLLIHAGDRPVSEADVRLLVTSVGLESIFTLMDALADRNGRTATSLLRRAIDSGEPPLRILALFARQVRLLVITRCLLDEGVSGGQMNARLGVPPFVAQKLQRQARRFSSGFLVAALRRLAQLDEDIKNGRVDAALALDTFVCELCGPAARVQSGGA